MPFKSDKQRRWMYANKPALARKWSAKYHNEGSLVADPVGDVSSFLRAGGYNVQENRQVHGYSSKSDGRTTYPASGIEDDSLRQAIAWEEISHLLEDTRKEYKKNTPYPRKHWSIPEESRAKARVLEIMGDNITQSAKDLMIDTMASKYTNDIRWIKESMDGDIVESVNDLMDAVDPRWWELSGQEKPHFKTESEVDIFYHQQHELTRKAAETLRNMYKNDGGQISNPEDDFLSMVEDDPSFDWSSLLSPRFDVAEKKPMKHVQFDWTKADIDWTEVVITVGGFLPIVGDAMAAYDTAEAFIEGNYKEAFILAGALAIGLIPGVGDAISITIKKGVKAGVKVASTFTNKVMDVIGPEFVLAHKDKVDDATIKVLREIVEGSDEHQVMMKHLNELVEEANRSGYKVEYSRMQRGTPDEGGPATGLITTPGANDGIIRIPRLETKADYLVALEEFEHALRSGLFGGEANNPIIRLREEIRAKTAAFERRRIEDISRSELEDALGESMRGYFGVIFEAAVSHDPIARDLINEVPSIDHPIWNIMNRQPLNKEKLLAGDKDEWTKFTHSVKNVDGRELAGDFRLANRPPKTRSISITHPDNTVSVVDGDNAAQAIVDATGINLKTVRNKISAGKKIVGPDGTIYKVSDKRAGASLKAEHIFDARESTLDNISGWDGTFSDLMHEYGIDPRSQEANNIRQKMARSTAWVAPDGKSYHRLDKESPTDKAARISGEIDERNIDKALTSTQKRIAKRNMLMDQLGMDKDDNEIANKFGELWSGQSKSIDKFKRQSGINQKSMDEIWITSQNAVEWRRFFNRYYPEKLKTTHARDQKMEIREMLNDIEHLEYDPSSIDIDRDDFARRWKKEQEIKKMLFDDEWS